MMEINCKISMLFNAEGLAIELFDDDACVKFIKIFLTPKQTMQAMSRLAHTDVDNCHIRGWDKVGKLREHKELIIEMPNDNWSNSTNKDIAKARAAEQCPEGWTPFLYFSSQNSFFEKDGKRFARTSMNRWLDKK